MLGIFEKLDFNVRELELKSIKSIAEKQCRNYVHLLRRISPKQVYFQFQPSKVTFQLGELLVK